MGEYMGRYRALALKSKEPLVDKTLRKI
jgi:hypothetical protein